jgi:peptide/nickel transport system substrate-binding protein
MKHHSHFKRLPCLFLLLAVLAFQPISASAEKVLQLSGSPNEFGTSTLNPIKMVLAHPAHWVIYDRFFEKGLDGQYYPGLAESWEFSPDGLILNMQLKKGVTFHDGSPFNAEVAKWFFNEMKTGPSAYMVAGIERVEINDSHDITLYFKRPDPNILHNFSTTFTNVPSMKAYKQYGPEDYGIAYTAGSGPFKLESWKKGDKMTLIKNPDYTWGSTLGENQGPAKIDKIVYREIEEESTQFLELKTGNLDILTSIPSMYIEKIKNDNRLNLVKLPGKVVFHLVMNTTSEPLNNKLVRKGIALSINQESITKNVFADAGQPAHTYLISSLPSEDVGEAYEIHYNQEEAEKALDKAGWTMGPDNIRVNEDGKPLQLEMFAKNESSYRRLAVVVQSQLAEIGVEAKITLLDPTTIRDQLRKGEHDLAVRSYNWENADILEWFFNSKRMGYPNAAMWHDNESDYLMQRAMTRAKNTEERIKYFKDYHRYLLSQYIWAPIYLPDQLFGVNERVVLPEPIVENRLLGATVCDYDLK